MNKFNLIAAIVAFGAARLAASATVPDAQLPLAIYTDPPSDPAHPATGEAVQFKSDGALLNAQLYRSSGQGLHPTVVLLHGMPGNEQNLDLAQTMRRAGWSVITFHYRGSWGSGGTFSLKGGIEDTQALLALLAQPGRAQRWGVDPSRIVLMGHSYGGYVAARAGTDGPGIVGVALIAPWDISFDRRAWAPLTAERRKVTGSASFDDVDGRLKGASALSLTQEVMRIGAQLDLTQLAPALASRALLVVTADRDDDDDKALGLLPALSQAHAEHLTVQVLLTDHSFNDRRIALQVVVLRWLATLPGAPSANLN